MLAPKAFPRLFSGLSCKPDTSTGYCLRTFCGNHPGRRGPRVVDEVPKKKIELQAQCMSGQLCGIKKNVSLQLETIIVLCLLIILSNRSV